MYLHLQREKYAYQHKGNIVSITRNVFPMGTTGEIHKVERFVQFLRIEGGDKRHQNFE